MEHIPSAQWTSAPGRSPGTLVPQSGDGTLHCWLPQMPPAPQHLEDHTSFIETEVSILNVLCRDFFPLSRRSSEMLVLNLVGLNVDTTVLENMGRDLSNSWKMGLLPWTSHCSDLHFFLLLGLKQRSLIHGRDTCAIALRSHTSALPLKTRTDTSCGI